MKTVKELMSLEQDEPQKKTLGDLVAGEAFYWHTSGYLCMRVTSTPGYATGVTLFPCGQLLYSYVYWVYVEGPNAGKIYVSAEAAEITQERKK